jgi:hypothetical protein
MSTHTFGLTVAVLADASRAQPDRRHRHLDTVRGPMTDNDVRSSVAEPVRSVRHRVDGDGWTGLVLGAALVAMALVAGLIYTFSVAVMPNLADADDRTFVATMQRFNENPVFQLSFTGALVLTALAAVLQRRYGPGSRCAGAWLRSCSTGSSSP